MTLGNHLANLILYVFCRENVDLGDYVRGWQDEDILVGMRALEGNTS